MADKDQEGGEQSAEPTAGGSSWAKLSEFYPYGDSPPRLAAGLNDTLTDASPTATFQDSTKTRKADAPGGTAKEGSPMSTPQADKVADPLQAKVVQDILTWIDYRLNLGVSAAWISQTAQMLEWSPKGGPEEGWAQVITEMFLGATYSGPGPTYALGTPLKRNDTGALVSDGEPAPAPARWETMVYRRIERKQWRYKNDRYGLQSWKLPIRFEADGDADNTDPAIPIGAACQHLTTYASITRGIPLDALGSGTFPAVGYMASDRNWGTAVFGGSGYDKLPNGKTASLPGFQLPNPKAKPKAKPGDSDPPPPSSKPPASSPPPSSGAPASAPPAGPKVHDFLDVKTGIDAGMGPGTIAIYDTDRGTEKAPPAIFMTEFELNKYGPDPTKIYGKYFKTRVSDEEASTFSSDWTKATRSVVEAQNDVNAQQKIVDDLGGKEKRTAGEDQKLEAAKAALAKAKAAQATDKLPRAAVAYPGAQQYEGAHIYCVLRKHPTKPMVQLLDVNTSDNLQTLDATGSDSILVEQREGIIDAGGRKQLYDMNNAFGGLGVLPAHTFDQAQVDFLHKARPIGLGRVAITRRGATTSDVKEGDVLYVSRLVRLYGDAPDKNYWMSKLLWSLRNTPGFTDVQVWWIVYAPRGLLAKAMWAHGAREMKLTDFVATHHDIGEAELLPVILLTNLGAPPRAGHATFYCRYKSRPDGSVTVVEFVPKGPPPPLMRHINPAFRMAADPSVRGLKWSESFAHPKITIDEAKLPAMFQAGG